MIRPVVIALVLIGGYWSTAAAADDSPSPVIVDTTQGGVWAGVTVHQEGEMTPASEHVATYSASEPTESDSTGTAADLITHPIDTALFSTFCAGVNWTIGCIPSSDSAPTAPGAVAAAAPVGAPPTLTPGMVAEAFRSVDLPASTLTVQPPHGRTLVNFATNFYTEQGSFTRVVRLLGRSVALRIWPSQFAWRFGDGRSLSTREPGAPYPHLEVTHEYLASGQVSPSVDTTYAAEFSVNGGPWRAVDGTVTIPGEPVRLDVVSATPELVGYR